MLHARQLDANYTLIRPSRLTVSRSDALVFVLLALTMLIGGYFRFMGRNWDDFVHFHPDERYLTQVATSLNGPLVTSQSYPDLFQECLQRYPETNGKGGYFDTECSPYNPENVTLSQYVYGTLPLFIARVVGDFAADSTGSADWVGYNGQHLIWRTVSAIADTLVILLVFFIGRQLHGKWVGLLAAILYAFAVFPIQQAHFATPDAVTNLFVALSIYFAVRTQDTGSLWDYAGFGLSLGAAVASRVNVAPLAGVIVVVAIIRVLPALDSRLGWNERNRVLMLNFAGLALAGIMSLLVFRLFNPYAFSGPGFFGMFPDDRYLATLKHAQFNVSGKAESPPNWQWVGRVGYLFPLQNMVLWGMGVALGITAWLGWIGSGWRLIRGRAGGIRNVVLLVWVGGYFAFTGRLWVMTMRYYLPLYAPLAVLAAWLLIELVKWAYHSNILWRKLATGSALAGVASLTVLWAIMFTNIYRHMATFTQASQWVWENVSGDFSMETEGADEDTPIINIPLINGLYSPDAPVDEILMAQSARLFVGQPVSISFVPPADGIISTIHAPHIGDPLDNSEVKTIEVSITKGQEPTPIAVATLSGIFDRTQHVMGSSYDLTFAEPLQVEAGQHYFFNVQVVSGNELMFAGNVMANEPWDEPMPAKICTLPFGVTLADDPPSGLLSARDCNGRDVWHGLLNGYTLDLHWEDVPEKRDRMQDMLDSTDYIIIATNRRYDSQSRIPARWPMTNRYYDALFSGELGFDLVKTFQEAFELGPIKISDQYLPTYSAPKWLNEFEAEEAFHVYDHPVVFIFKKNQSYSPENTMAILGDAELNSVGSVFGGYNDPTITGVINNLWSLDADPAPTQLEFTKDMQSIQDAGGTWSDRFSRESIINTNQVVATLVWWAAIVVFGWITYPILFIAFPALGDRGYAFAKFTGMLIVGWGTWALSSLRIAVWSQGGILGGFTLLAALNVWIVWRNREKFSTFLRTRWRLLAWIEGVTFILFIVFVAIRLSNPDLWHSSFGGEKPMDFAYFNATLRSTIFPPIDPWFADGFLNYYYFGYVIVGVPTLLLGVVPSLAYNLIIPTLFSITGISAFSVTYSIVNGWRSKLDVARLPDAASLESSPPSPKRRSLGNPWVAGVMALLLAVVLGNLDTVRVFGLGVANVGGYKQPISLQSYLVDEYVQDFGVPPDETATLEIAERASEDRFGDRLQYEWHNVSSLIGGIFRGFGEMLSGADLHISSERWFWAPTRIIAEIPNSGDGAINEMPFFTFLYGDLHAHMIAMPMMLFAMAFVYNELMISGRDRRRKFAQFVAIALGALTVGMFQATNTWDVPTFMLLSVLGLAYAWWLRWKKFTRWSIWDGFVRVGGFIALALAVALPFSFWFASGLTSFKVWQGNKTPFWAYFQIHGLFLFLLISLLLWETARWLRAVRVAQIRGKLPLLSAILFATGMILLGSLILAAIEYQVALIVIPLVWWIALLFLRPGQSRPMQYILVLAGLALAITLGTEVVTLANDNGRQNTIFKFYIQAWLLLSVACGAGFSWMVGGSGKWSGRLAVVWYSVAGLLIFIAALYPIMATRGKSQFRMAPDTPMTLDGMEYMRNASHFEDGVSDIFELKYDYQTIRWLQDNVQGSPVIMEAQSKGSLYKWGGRISINTGLPSVIGWDYHQRQQRSVNPLPSMVNQRAANVNAFYTTEDITAAAEILRVYDVKYVILTAYEQARYGNSGGLDKFDEMVERGMLSVAYHEDLSTIYEVNPDMLEAIHVASLINRAEQDNQS